MEAERQQESAEREKLEAQLKAAYKDDEPARFDGPIANYERDPRTYAMSLTVGVGVSGTLIGERSAANGEGCRTAGRPTSRSSSTASADVSGTPTWSSRRTRRTLPDALAQKLAERVRDRIPDLPFAATNAYQSYELGSSRSPCSLLTRAEAEAVLGPLLVEPYLSSTDAPGLAHPRGHACAYYTAGHHALVISPNWSNGPFVFKLDKGMGGLMSMVMPPDDVAMEGPWDDTHVNVMGALMFLKGKHLLTVHYVTASTDRRGAVKLAAQAIQRM